MFFQEIHIKISVDHGIMQVANIEADLYDFHEFPHGEKIDIQVHTEYETPNSFSIIARRLDKSEGWKSDMKVLVYYRHNQIAEEYSVGSSDLAEKRIHVKTDFQIFQDDKPAKLYPTYDMIQPPEPTAIKREEFNALFNTDIVVLPELLYAVGLKDGKVYMYSDFYTMYFEVMRSINHILTTILTYHVSEDIYFVVCSGDGYMEEHYKSERVVPRIIGEEEYRGFHTPIVQDPAEYPVLHKNKYILCYSALLGTPFLLGIPDRHFFLCNYYHEERSVHRGIPFKSKINKMIFGGRSDRGDKHNFTELRDMNMNQRQYFLSDAIDKTNIICSEAWIDKHEMVKYKYILDIDGRASTWDATAWKLNSGSVIFKVESIWRQWFYDEYLPWVHYIPVKNDFSDIHEKWRWCEENQDKCEEISKNAMDLFQKVYRYQNIVEHTIGVLTKL
jgi:hypothetical protein